MHSAAVKVRLPNFKCSFLCVLRLFAAISGFSLFFAALREIFPYLAAFPAFPPVSLALRAERNTFRRANDMRPLDTKPR
jgi:hypothetical protein